jgi:hypothetical protein
MAQIKCNSCELMRIQGIVCHETGCPNTNARYDSVSGEWVKQRRCWDCGCSVDADDLCCSAEPELEAEDELERARR